MTELQLGKYEFYPNEELEEWEKIIIQDYDDEPHKNEFENEIENKFFDAARKYLAEKEAKKKNKRKRKK